MAKTKISEFDIDPANNTDINSINIAEGCAPSGINNAIRQLMSDLKEFQTGAGGDSITATGVYSDTIGEKTSAAGVTVDGVLIKDNAVTASGGFSGALNGAVGGTTPAAGAFTTLSASGAFSANGGATLGDASGDALTINSSAVSIPNGLNFDSNTFVIDATNNRVGIGQASPSTSLQITKGSGSTLRVNSTGANQIFAQVDNTTNTTEWGVLAAGESYISSNGAYSQLFYTNGSERMRIDSSGNLGLGVTPSAWQVAAGRKAIEVGSAGNGLYGYSASNFNMSAGAYFNGTNWIYSASSTEVTYYNQSAGLHKWYTAPSGTAGNAITFTQAMTLNASGNLGIGTSSPGEKLDVSGRIKFSAFSTDVNDYALYVVSGVGLTLSSGPSSGSTAMAFRTGNAERMRIDSSGNLGLGVTPSAWGGSAKAIQISSRTALSTPDGNATHLSNNSYYNGTNYIYLTSALASVYQQVNGVHSWSTAVTGTAGNTISFTTPMTLDASGNLMVGTTTLAGNGFTMYPNGSGGGIYTVYNRPATSSTTTALDFKDGGTTKGSISYTNTATSFNTSSDYRLKENVAPMTGALAKNALLKPCTYTWKADGSAGEGFIAHELAEVMPNAVTGEKDAVNEDGSIKPQGIDTSFLVGHLVACIQELKAEVDSLKAQLNK